MTQGLAAEMIVAVEAAVRGFEVLHPFGGKATYDLAIERHNVFHRLQVKEIYFGKTAHGGRWMADFMKPKGNYRTKRYEKYTKADCDFVVAVCVKHRRLFLFPVEVVSATRQISFYFDSTPSPMARVSSWAMRYENAWPE